MDNQLTKPSGVTSVEARPPGTSLESTINHDGPSCSCQLLVAEEKEVASHNLIETLRSTQTSWASSDDENVDLAVGLISTA